MAAILSAQNELVRARVQTYLRGERTEYEGTRRMWLADTFDGMPDPDSYTHRFVEERREAHASGNNISVRAISGFAPLSAVGEDISHQLDPILLFVSSPSPSPRCSRTSGQHENRRSMPLAASQSTTRRAHKAKMVPFARQRMTSTSTHWASRGLWHHPWMNVSFAHDVARAIHWLPNGIRTIARENATKRADNEIIFLSLGAHDMKTLDGRRSWTHGSVFQPFY